VALAQERRDGLVADDAVGASVLVDAHGDAERRADRDVERGGVIKFLPAFGLGLAIAVCAGIAYACVWEIYLASTGYRFMDEYIAAMLRHRQAEGASAAELARLSAEMAPMRTSYANPLFRFPMTFLEIFPVGLIVALISAALLRNPRLLPARAVGRG
jgi:hypothetical protein